LRTSCNEKNDIVNIIDPKNYCEINNNPLDHIIDKWFVNYSGMEIPIEVSKLLQMGGKFCLPVNDDKKSTIFEFIKDLESNSNKHIAGYLDSIRSSVLLPLKEFISHNKQPTVTEAKIKDLLNKTRVFVRNHPAIIFTRADKGNVTVALRRVDYINKIEEILSDTDTYS